MNLRKQLEEINNLIEIKNKEIWNELDILQEKKDNVVYSIIKTERLLEGVWYCQDGCRYFCDTVRPILNTLLDFKDYHCYYKISEKIELHYDDQRYNLYIKNCDIQTLKNLLKDLYITLNFNIIIEEKKSLQRRILEIDKKYNELLRINNG